MANVFDLLDAEWRRLSCDRSAARRLRPVCHVAGGAWSLGEVERFVRAAHPADADRVLLALVSRAVADDQLAARVLLQLLLPGTRALARRWWALGEPDERAAAAVTAVYHRICHYPLERRPGRVAANVLLDAAQELRRRVPRLVTVPAADPGAGRDSPRQPRRGPPGRGRRRARGRARRAARWRLRWRDDQRGRRAGRAARRRGGRGHRRSGRRRAHRPIAHRRPQGGRHRQPARPAPAHAVGPPSAGGVDAGGGTRRRLTGHVRPPPVA